MFTGIKMSNICFKLTKYSTPCRTLYLYENVPFLFYKYFISIITVILLDNQH